MKATAKILKIAALLPFKAIFTVATLLIPFTVIYPFIGGFVLLIAVITAESQGTLITLGALWGSSLALYAIGRMVATPKDELRYWWEDCCTRWGLPTEEEF